MPHGANRTRAGRTAARAPVALFLLAFILLGTGQASAGKGDDREPRVRVATSGDFSERVERLTLERDPSRGREVVMSLTPRRLPTVVKGDRLEVSAEVQVTVDCHQPSSRCIGRPYGYNPDLELQIVLASGATDTGGNDTVSIGAPRREVCRQSPPNREHHCVVVFKRTLPRVAGGTPCLEGRCHVNVVAGASSPRARRGEYVAVGGLRPNGSVPQDRGRLNVVRFHPAADIPSRKAITRTRVDHRLHLDQRRQVVYSQRLQGLEAGEQLVVDAHARLDISALPYNVVLSSQLILTDSRAATDRGLAKEWASLRGEFDEGNGFNCTKNLDVCKIHKVGVLRMNRDAERSGRPTDLFATLVVRAGPKHLKARGSDRVQVLDAGSLTVERYAAKSGG